MANGEPLGRAEFWQRMAGFAFGMWALMIPIGVAMVRAGVEDVLTAQKQQADVFNAYVLTMERRVTLIEERQAALLNMFAEHERRIDRERQLFNGNGGRR